MSVYLTARFNRAAEHARTSPEPLNNQNKRYYFKFMLYYAFTFTHFFPYTSGSPSLAAQSVGVKPGLTPAGLQPRLTVDAREIELGLRAHGKARERPEPARQLALELVGCCGAGESAEEGGGVAALGLDQLIWPVAGVEALVVDEAGLTGDVGGDAEGALVVGGHALLEEGNAIEKVHPGRNILHICNSGRVLHLKLDVFTSLYRSWHYFVNNTTFTLCNQKTGDDSFLIFYFYRYCSKLREIEVIGRLIW